MKETNILLFILFLMKKRPFFLAKIEGKKRPVQVFFDTGCNCTIIKDSVQKEFNAALLNPGPFLINVAS